MVVRSAVVRSYCVHRNDWNLLLRSDGAPVVSDKIKRSFRDEARFKMNYYTARAATIADKIKLGSTGVGSSAHVDSSMS